MLKRAWDVVGLPAVYLLIIAAAVVSAAKLDRERGNARAVSAFTADPVATGSIWRRGAP